MKKDGCLLGGYGIGRCGRVAVVMFGVGRGRRGWGAEVGVDQCRRKPECNRVRSSNPPYVM